MNESDLFNRDTMYWREINFSSPNAIAKIELVEPMTIQGEELLTIECGLMLFEAHEVEYQMENGGAFLKNEVKTWPFVLLTDLDFYKDLSNSEEARNAKLISVLHSNVQSIALTDRKGNLIVKKTKV